MHGDYYDDDKRIPPQPGWVKPPPIGRPKRRTTSLDSAFQELRDAGGDGWDAIDDPETFLGRDNGEE